MKKLVALALIGVMSLGIFAGCGNGNEKNAAPAEQTNSNVEENAGEESEESGGQEEAANDAGEAVTISAMIQQSRYYDGLQAMIDKLKEEENIIIDVQVVPDAESLNMLKMKLNSGEAPDMIDYNIPAIYDIVDPAKNFADMSNEAWVGRLQIPDNVTCKADGKIYGFPFLSVPGTHGFIYNMEAFEKAGIKEVPATWAELLEACDTLKAAGITPIYVPKDSWVPQILMTDNFAKILGADGAQEFADKLMNKEANGRICRSLRKLSINIWICMQRDISMTTLHLRLMMTPLRRLPMVRQLCTLTGTSLRRAFWKQTRMQK